MSVEGVSGIFGRVLQAGGVEADSDFFALGGDSLLATRVISAVARDYGVELSFDDFAVAPTPAGLAERIAAALAEPLAAALAEPALAEPLAGALAERVAGDR